MTRDELRERVTALFTAASAFNPYVDAEKATDTAIALVRRETLEEAARVAKAEKMTGIPPIGQWTPREIEIAEVTTRVTGRSIAAAILALGEK